MNEKGLGAYQVRRNLEKLEESLRNKFGVRWECFGRETKKYRGAIEDAGAFSINPSGIEEVSRLRLKKCLRSLTDSKVSRRCRDGFSKQFFEMWKIQIWMQSNIQLNQWSNQHKNLSIQKKFEHKDLQNTHTHTLNKSNQFYISKISQDSLVSIH